MGIVKNEQIAQSEPASGQEAYHKEERAAWSHPKHPTRECPYDQFLLKLATFGPNWREDIYHTRAN